MVFDFDGTLADSAAWFVETLNAAAGRFGYRRLPEDELDSLRSLATRDVVRRLGEPLWRMPAIARHFRAEAAAKAGPQLMFDGFGALVAGVRQQGPPRLARAHPVTLNSLQGPSSSRTAASGMDAETSSA